MAATASASRLVRMMKRTIEWAIIRPAKPIALTGTPSTRRIHTTCREESVSVGVVLKLVSGATLRVAKARGSSIALSGASSLGRKGVGFSEALQPRAIIACSVLGGGRIMLTDGLTFTSREMS